MPSSTTIPVCDGCLVASARRMVTLNECVSMVATSIAFPSGLRTTQTWGYQKAFSPPSLASGTNGTGDWLAQPPPHWETTASVRASIGRLGLRSHVDVWQWGLGGLGDLDGLESWMGCSGWLVSWGRWLDSQCCHFRKGGRSSSYRKTTIPILPLVPSVPCRDKTGSPPRDQPRSIWHDINKPMARFGVQAPRRGSADQSGSAEAMMLWMGVKGKQKHRQIHNRGGPYPPEPTCATYRRS